MKDKNYIILGALILFIVLVFVFVDPKTDSSIQKATLNLPEKEISLIVADTDETRTRGLSGKRSLPRDSAMLFVFPELGEHGIWMKDMNFSIDIIWLDQEKKIVHIEERISPETYPEIFYSKKKAMYVIETIAGFVAKNGLKIGQILEISL